METLLITTNTSGVYLWVLDNPRLRSSCFINSIQRRRKPCYGRETHVPKRIWLLSPKSKTRQRAMSRGVTQAVFYPLVWLANDKTKGFASRKSFCRSGSRTLFFGGREATTGNTSDVPMLMMPLIGESLDFGFHFFKQQFEALLEQFYIFSEQMWWPSWKWFYACWLSQKMKG